MLPLSTISSTVVDVDVAASVNANVVDVCSAKIAADKAEIDADGNAVVSTTTVTYDNNDVADATEKPNACAAKKTHKLHESKNFEVRLPKFI